MRVYYKNAQLSTNENPKWTLIIIQLDDNLG